jgi:SAM-dependent methyltransferase
MGELMAAGAYRMNLNDALPFLVSPDSGERLVVADSGELCSVSGGERFPMVGGLPQLFLRRFHPFLGADALNVRSGPHDDAILQYGLLATVKFCQGFPNSPHDSPWYRTHLDDVRRLVCGAKGDVLDIGCDSPSISAALFGPETRYLGLDPLYYDRTQFRILGMAEFLPIKGESFDNVCLLSVLDHTLDQHRTLDQAYRVLRPGGTLYFQILVWTAEADVMHDHFHFHHFREYELLGALHRFEIVEFFRRRWKNDTHRTSVYIAARKPG